MADIEKYVADVKKYRPAVDEAAVAGIVKHLGIALRNRDSSLVSGGDPEETKRVRESWCKKKLGVTQADTEIDKAVADVIASMKADKTKERVTVYYLLADKFGKLGSLAKK
jgi:hypothetical protein